MADPSAPRPRARRVACREALRACAVTAGARLDARLRRHAAQLSRRGRLGAALVAAVAGAVVARYGAADLGGGLAGAQSGLVPELLRVADGWSGITPPATHVTATSPAGRPQPPAGPAWRPGA